MLTKNSFILTYFLFMLPNTEKHKKLYLHDGFHWNKRSITLIILDIIINSPSKNDLVFNVLGIIGCLEQLLNQGKFLGDIG